MKKVVNSEKEGLYEVDVAAISDWDGFELLAKFIEKNYGGEVINRIEGPESRVWTINIDEKIITLHNNPYGNSFKASDNEAIELLKIISKDLENRLSQ